MRLELGHKTVIEIEDGKPIMYVSNNGNIPLSFRYPLSTVLEPTARIEPPPQRAFKKIAYVGSE